MNSSVSFVGLDTSCQTIPNVKLTRHPNREELEMIVENVNLSIRDRTT